MATQKKNKAKRNSKTKAQELCQDPRVILCNILFARADRYTQLAAGSSSHAGNYRRLAERMAQKADSILKSLPKYK